MTKEQKENIKGYINRCIPDIARKCEVTQNEVILVMSEFIPCELKEDTLDYDYVVIAWPEIQDIMDKEGFRLNSSLANNEWSLEKYGSSTYFVNKQWLKSISE